MSLISNPNYDPNKLLDELKVRFKLNSDAELCYMVDISRPLLSKIRHKKVPLGASTLLKIYDETKIPIEVLRTLMGVEVNNASC